jgi:ribosomal protein L16/L10AE
MFQISNAKKNRIKCKKLLKSNGLKKTPFIAPNVVFFKVCEDSVFTRDQLLKLNQLISKTIKRRGKIRFPVGQLIARTEKSIGTRMGKGKGSISN